MKHYIYLSILILLSFITMACASTKSEPLTLTILHVNDTHSHLESLNYDLMLGGEKTRVKLGGFDRLVSIINEEKEQSINPILLHAGDALTGTIYYTLFQGKSDAEVLNTVDWDAFALGNHEFDDGNEVLKLFLDKLDTATVAANVVAEKGSILKNKWKPYKIMMIDGQKIGIIGIDIVGKTKNSSNPGDDISFYDEIETTKKYVAELEKKKINKIIVLTHIGHENAKNMAKKVSGVDIIVTGDSHSFLGNADTDAVGVNKDDVYPAMQVSPSGEPVAVVQAWEYSKLLGKLQVDFNREGIIENIEGYPIIILDDSFKRKNSEGKRVELEGEARDTIYAEIKNNPSLAIVNSDTETLRIIEKYRKEKDVVGKAVIAEISEDIPGGSAERIPKESEGGHFTAQLVANGMLYKLRSSGTGKVDAVIQNAGGVRIPLLQGPIDTETIFSLLPFSNTLVSIELTGLQIKTALEQSIDYALNPSGSTGSFPYTAGLRYTADLKQSLGSRVSNIEIEKDGAWNAIDDTMTYIVGINNYIAGGKDGYVIFGEIDDSKKIDMQINDADTFTEYIKYLKKVDKPAKTNVILK